ncbi:MAG: glyoxylate reductase [Gaiellaceae bacterium]|jgi:lactate dehydrogenase-like 2-hydroxyacid dehydrogenase|nr:glyoxylate reductase [Gaiellaceae bacterium]
MQNATNVDLTGQPRVHVAGPVPTRVMAALEQDFDLVPVPAGAEGILSLITTIVDDAYLERAGPQLEVVANYGVGVNNIDLEAARRRGIVIANTPDVLTKTTAELAIAVTLALLRRVVEGDRYIRARSAWSFSLEFMLGEGLDGKTVGIVGAGRIGRETARLAEAFGAQALFAGRDDPLEELLASADVVSLHCPLTPHTRHLIDEQALATMKSSAVLVNTARGPIVDERALVDALSRKVIAGAALDVFEFEPDISEELLSMEQVVLTPHMGSGTRETREAMGLLAVDALRSVLILDRTPANVVP